MRFDRLALLGLVVLVSCAKDAKHIDLEDRDFKIEVRQSTTPVKNQGKSQACWLYSVLSMIESEHIALGDSVNLSANFILLKNKNQNERGVVSKAFRLLLSHGTVPYDSCKDGDSYMPKTVMMLGCEYTPKQFAGSVCRDDEYTCLTSFCDHPYGEKFVLDIPDNTDRDSFLNVPLDTLMAIMDRTIRMGHTFVWEGDTSNDDFSFSDGIAYLDSNLVVTEEMRQKQFNSGLTSDNHCMHIVGIAHNGKGEKFYIAKNSWGKNGRYKGYMMVNENYLRLRTIIICLPKELL